MDVGRGCTARHASPNISDGCDDCFSGPTGLGGGLLWLFWGRIIAVIALCSCHTRCGNLQGEGFCLSSGYCAGVGIAGL